MNSAPASELGRVGQIVAGKFRLDKMIGRGGMGSVWSATHVGLGHRLALKLIAREYVRSPEALRRFDAEAKAAARLQSRHVVQVFDNGTLDDGTPFIAMELLTGENLSERIARAGPLGLAATVEILAQCCKALGRAHAAGIVHRDIKPDNVFLAREPDEDADVAKILDFGVAKMALELETASQVTGTGALLGTPLYMSPEQIRGARDVDQRADLYSLGLVAYTMLTGKVAISGESFGDILVKICTLPLPSLLAAAPSLPPTMEAWFQRACAREPGDRYASAQELIGGLRGAAGALASAGRLSTYPPRSAPAAGGSLYAQSAAVAATLAAPGAGAAALHPDHAAALHQSAALAASQGARPAFSQSAAAVSLTAAGGPRKQTGAMLAGWAVAAVLALSGAVALAVSLHRGDSASVDPAAARPSAPPTASAAAIAPPVAPSVVLAAPVDETARPGVSAATATPPPRALVSASLPPFAASARPMSSAIPPSPSGRRPPRIDVGY